MALIRTASHYRSEPIAAGWELAEQAPASGSVAHAELRPETLAWRAASCPGTVASALRSEKAWDFSQARDFDASDWHYRARFTSTPAEPGEQLVLEFDGLATLCDVWLNGEHVLRSENMFVAHTLDVTSLLREDNELYLRFASLSVASAVRRPRPRFKTRLVERQQLRWFRTTLLGRIPAWSPPVSAVGPWRAVRLVRRRGLSCELARLSARIEAGRALVTAYLDVKQLGATLRSATLRVGDSATRLDLTGDDRVALRGELELKNAERWWPHGYGAQPRYPAHVELELDGETHELGFDPLSFRTLQVDETRDGFALVVNDREIRCRGACWTPSDVVSLTNETETLRAVAQARAAGMNMLRVGGTMVYESDAFYDACDRSGILVWQDFMFANLDYPGEDSAFRASVTREAEQFLARTETRACLGVLCGNSEVEQQIAMLGLPREAWSPPLFAELLKGISAHERADVPYVPSTPTGGALPFQADFGLTHYYGVGAYLRPLEDARRANVKFTPECLGFANIPEQSTVEHLLGDGRAPFHHPLWKARVPRDNGPGWDFDDVRDHYTQLLFGLDPAALRYEDADRALALGRVTSGEVMARTIGEWRRADSACRGALIWFLRDLWPGAGWGLIDALGTPKAAYHYVKRAMQSRALFLSDEGLNGLVAHALNDTPEPLAAELELELFRRGSVSVARAKQSINVPAFGASTLHCASWFDHFIDLTHAYRFGPSQYDVAVARLRDAQTGEPIARACFFPGELPCERADDLGLRADAEQLADGGWQLRLKSERFAFAVALEIADFQPEDAYFELAPGEERVLTLAGSGSAAPRGFVTPLNASAPTRVNVVPRSST